MDKIETFIKRLENIGIEVKLKGNLPWVYLESINGKRVDKEDYTTEYGFVLAYTPIRPNQEISFTDLKRIFNIIRKYRNND